MDDAILYTDVHISVKMQHPLAVLPTLKRLALENIPYIFCTTVFCKRTQNVLGSL